MLSLAKLFAELAAGVGAEQIARVEPVSCDGPAEHRAKVAREVGDARAAPVPQCPALRSALEGEHLFHAAVAVRRDDEDDSVRKPYDDVVMKLSLLPVIEQLVASVLRSEVVEERPEDEVIGEPLQVSLHPEEV